MTKTTKQVQSAYNRGARYAVAVHYSAPRLGEAGEIVSTHGTYDLARAAAKRSGWDDHLAIRKIAAVAGVVQ